MNQIRNRFFTIFGMAAIAMIALGLFSPNWSVLLLGILAVGLSMIGLLVFYVLPTPSQ